LLEKCTCLECRRLEFKSWSGQILPALQQYAITFQHLVRK